MGAQKKVKQLKSATKEFKDRKENKNISFIIISIGIVAIFIAIAIENTRTKNNDTMKAEYQIKSKIPYFAYSIHTPADDKNGILKHVHLVLERLGYELDNNSTQWKLLWAHDFPFRVFHDVMTYLGEDQKINHFPGTGFITNKVDFATKMSKYSYIPKAFKLPEDKNNFLEYAEDNKNAMFLQKHNQHRGVVLKNVTDIDLLSGESFVQEYVQNPLLVDGYKFDIGVYVVLTSVDPLRVYWYKGDVLFRYCPEKYYPFDPKNLNKYVVADDYRPTWKVPALADTYSMMGFGMKGSFDTYIQTQGLDPDKIWSQVIEILADVFLKKEHHIVTALKSYPRKDSFFELIRFDFTVDDHLKVYLLEANMSPNLSSAHYAPNQLLYEQVLYNLFMLTGVALDSTLSLKTRETNVKSMITSSKNIAVYGKECETVCRSRCDANPVCALCKQCMSDDLKLILEKAHQENLHRGDYQRIFPPMLKQKSLPDMPKNLSEYNRLQYLWFQGKCDVDVTWCS